MFTGGVKLLAAAEKMGLEGVVSKQRETGLATAVAG
jgi:ATP-dependent DNA ligase